MHVTVRLRIAHDLCLLIEAFKGTTRIGNSPNNSVADAKSRIHGCPNLWVGGNGCLPDATGSNPTRTSVCFQKLIVIGCASLTLYSIQVAIALEGARSVIEYIKPMIV